jgi:tRNA A-37 threonylcarbamoyl transferase component Bud32
LRGALRIALSARRIGFANTLATARDVYWRKFAANFAGISLVLHNRMRKLRRARTASTMHELRQDLVEILIRGRSGYRVGLDQLSDLGVILPELDTTTEVVIGEIDQDGFVRSQVGELRGIPTVDANKFVPRIRYGLTLVSCQGVLAVRKDYRGDIPAFLREVRALDSLAAARCNVPALLDVDFQRLQIVISYIVGTVIREALANRGAIVRDRDAQREFSDLSPDELRITRIGEGRKVIADVVNESFVESLFQQIRLMHAHRLIWGDIKYGNIIMESATGKPYIIDFNSATYHPRLADHAFRRLVDGDIEKFNSHFGTDKLTMRRLQQQAEAISRSKVYAPACFAAGISIGNVWDNSAGYGRWRFLLNHSLPSMKGARVLDLGANNGFNSIQLLRNGAREVVAVELDDVFFEQGKFLRDAYEYTDYASYNFRYLHADMRNIVSMDLGRFDFAMALCSIYYLNDQDIARVARHLSTITDTFVLQCNVAVGINRSDPRTYVKASVEYAREVLTDAGFGAIQVIAPQYYPRPLVIGRRLL